MLAQRSTTAGSSYNYYALTISPTKLPTTIPFWDLKSLYLDFLKSFEAEDLEHSFELKKGTDVVHMHCYIRCRRSLYFKKVKGSYLGNQLYFKQVRGEAQEKRWCNYLYKEAYVGQDRKAQQLWAHAARNINLFTKPEKTKGQTKKKGY